ncbi:MAG: hypothetical protein JKX78_04595 [Alteromonadaceae bacterium]|nr:hypothetical protein [Alteromonadaceae bacterium]
MKNLVIKIATWAFMIGLLFTGFGLWDIYKERNVNSEAIVMEFNTISDPNGSLIYAEISGGQLDIANTYELSLSTKKSDAKLTSDFYTPVINNENSTVAYILKSALEPTIQEMVKKAEYKGLLQSKSELPKKILAAYNKSFPNTKFVYLDSTFKPETFLEKIIGLKIFFYLLVGGLAVRLMLNGKRKTPIEEASAQEEAA